MKRKWYLSTPVISLMFAFWFFILPLIVGIILLIFRLRQDKANQKSFDDICRQCQEMKDFNASVGFERYEDVTQKVNEVQNELDELIRCKELKKQEIFNEVKTERDRVLAEAAAEKNRILAETQAEKNRLIREIHSKRAELQNETTSLSNELVVLNNLVAKNTAKAAELNSIIADLEDKENKQAKQIANQQQKLRRIKELYKGIEYCIENFFNYTPTSEHLRFSASDLKETEELAPTVIAQLHCMSIPDLKKAFRENDKQINTVFDQYSKRYTTKGNIAIYSLMVIALRSELQNVLLNLKYEKQEAAINEIKEICAKYLSIAGNGNQSIVGTLTKFIGEIEYLFINAVKIEYNYYIKKEQARQEQLALREQMRQEAEERKALEIEKKRIAQEESKFVAEIDKIKEQMKSSAEADVAKFKARILELESQLSDIVVKKEQISNLANGKAGNVYIISNLGSFGENVFKIGMTRRLNPIDRINELGSASVPFKFDVHSFIFSDDAVGLENKLHTILNDKRVNKVNLRKEFFRASIDELENLVHQIEPTAEFNKTMLAEEFRQSESGEIVLSTLSDLYVDDLDE